MSTHSVQQREKVHTATEVLLPVALDERAAKDPYGIYASFPKGGDIALGFDDFTNADVASAVDAFAWWLQSSLGRSEAFDTLGYIGVSDLRYVIFFFGCIKAGYKALFFSPRNSTSQNASLLEQTQCKTLFHSEKFNALCKELQNHQGQDALAVHELSPFPAWVSVERRPFPYTKSFEEARYDPVVVLHSSGSTGPPKVIAQNHQFFTNIHRPVTPPPGKTRGAYALWDLDEPGFTCTPFPFYHLAGLQSVCIMPVFYRNCRAACGYPDRPATPEMVAQILQQREVKLMYAPPSIIEGLIQMSGSDQLLGKLDDIIYAGGPLAPTTGQRLVELTRVSSCYGFSETGALSCFVPDQSEWQFFEFNPQLKFEMEQVLEGAYEMVLYRDDRANDLCGIGATILREQDHYRSKDLFVPHPTKKGLWRYFGRHDDIIVLSSGQKWNPLPSESLISSHPQISAALAVGTGRFQPALLVECNSVDFKTNHILRAIWPLVKRANACTNRFGRITKFKILVYGPDTFLRTPKGTISRKATVRFFENDIESLYSRDLQEPSPTAPKLSREELDYRTLVRIVRNCISEESSVGSVEEHADLFVAGLDSIDAIEISNALRGILSAVYPADSLSFVRSQLVFQHPTVKSLATAISERLMIGLEKTLGPKTPKLSLEVKHRIDYAEPYAFRPRGSDIFTVAISGTTGSLGSHILELFLGNRCIKSVICLNRGNAHAAEAKTRILLRHLADEAWQKVSFWPVDYQQTDLALSEAKLDTLSNVDAILHCAWKLDFNQSVRSFEPQVEGVVNLARLVAKESKQFQRFFFVSSTSTTPAGCCGDTPIPESVMDREHSSLATGYAQSKYISEHLLATASKRLNLPVTILRVGQIAGSDVEDAKTAPGLASSTCRPWNLSEWFPSLITTSQRLRVVPSDMPSVNWLPVTSLARVIAELVAHDLSREGLQVYNLVNPHTVTWASLLPAVVEPSAATKGEPMRTLPLGQWIDLLSQYDVRQAKNVEALPALKLLPFLQEKQERAKEGKSQVLVTEGARGASETFRNLKPIGQEHMRFWIRQWGAQKIDVPQETGLRKRRLGDGEDRGPKRLRTGGERVRSAGLASPTIMCV